MNSKRICWMLVVTFCLAGLNSCIPEEMQYTIRIEADYGEATVLNTLKCRYSSAEDAEESVDDIKTLLEQIVGAEFHVVEASASANGVWVTSKVKSATIDRSPLRYVILPQRGNRYKFLCPLGEPSGERVARSLVPEGGSEEPDGEYTLDLEVAVPGQIRDVSPKADLQQSGQVAVWKKWDTDTLFSNRCVTIVFENPDFRLPEDALNEQLAMVVKWLKDEDEKVRRDAAILLQHCGDAGNPAVPQLKTCFEIETDDAAKRLMACALGALNGSVAEILDDLTDDLDSEDPETRAEAVELIRCLGKKATPAVPALVKACEIETDLSTKAAIVAILVEYDDCVNRVVDSLVQDLKSQNASTRIQAASLLGTLGGKAKAAIPALKEAFKKEADAAMKEAMANAIRKID